MDSSDVNLCFLIAQRAHEGQKRYDGTPYIGHPLAVAFAMRTVEDKHLRYVCECAAWLHDVIEDCPDWTFDRLKREGVPDEVVAAVQVLTHGANESYRHYIERIADSGVRAAVLVKIADLTHNRDSSNGKSADPTEYRQRRDKYDLAIAFLSEALSPQRREWIS